MTSALRLSPSPSPTRSNFFPNDTDDDETDQGSQRSIPLSSPTTSVFPAQDEQHASLSTARSLDHYDVPKVPDSKNSEIVNVIIEKEKDTNAGVSVSAPSGSIADTSSSPPAAGTTPSTRYPPAQISMDDASSMISYSSTSSRKARPESSVVEPPAGPLVPGIALVDFNHLVGPQIEFSDGSLFDDEQLVSVMPFLALPDGAHLSTEDYSYFHLVPSAAKPATIFGISCNRQIKASELLVKDEDVTRSTVQKAVVVLASKPLFGPIRDRLGVVTRALFEQRDFRETNILVDFKSSLELSLRTQLTESALYMGTNLRELVHKFRSRTLLLLKTLMLQKRIMLFGHPVERLCTYQYSLISLIPGLLQNLDDCGSPPLASRAPTLSRATSLRTSDRKSLLSYLGLPLDIFGKDAFFQPYLPLQQVDLLKETQSFLCGCTNSIVTQQKEIDLLINIETNAFEFRDPRLEKLVALTPADRKWMDDIVRDVNETWNDADPTRSAGMQFKGSDDYLRTKFEEYITAALASVKYADFITKGRSQDIVISGADGGDANAIQDFNPLWIAEFRRTNAFEVWNRITDPMLFDIIEARHPCSGKANVVVDIGLRLSEGLQDLHIQEQLAPTREALSRTFASGSTSFFKAVEGVRGRWSQKSVSSFGPGEAPLSTSSSTPVEISRSEIDLVNASASNNLSHRSSSILSSFSLSSATQTQTQSQGRTLKPLNLQSASQAANDTKAALNTWGTNIGSFISQQTSRLSVPRTDSTATASSGSTGSSSAYSTQPSPAGSPPLGGTSESTNNVVVGQSKSTTSLPPVSSLFSSWSFGRTSPVKTRSSTSVDVVSSTAGVRDEADIDPSFKPKDLGEFGPLPSRSDNSINVQPGLAL